MFTRAKILNFLSTNGCIFNLKVKIHVQLSATLAIFRACCEWKTKASNGQEGSSKIHMMNDFPCSLAY